jgi:hypothetical protein
VLAGARLDAADRRDAERDASSGRTCLRRGLVCPCWSEKPIAEPETADRLRDTTTAAQRAGVALLVGHHRRYNPVITLAREIVRGGRIGRLTAVSAQWLLQKPSAYFDVAWRVDRKGGGPVLINLIHDIDDLRFICGEIASVQAMTANAARGNAVEDTAVIALRFADGALGTVTLSDAVAAPWSWEITSGEAANYAAAGELLPLRGNQGFACRAQTRALALSRRLRLGGAACVRAAGVGRRGSAGPAAPPFLPRRARRGRANHHRDRCYADVVRDVGGA